MARSQPCLATAAVCGCPTARRGICLTAVPLLGSDGLAERVWVGGDGLECLTDPGRQGLRRALARPGRADMGEGGPASSGPVVNCSLDVEPVEDVKMLPDLGEFLARLPLSDPVLDLVPGPWQRQRAVLIAQAECHRPSGSECGSGRHYPNG